MTPRRAACLAAVVLAVAVAAPILHAGSGRTPPTSSGPLKPVPTGPVCFNGPGSPVASCVFDYQLDPAATNDPSVDWHAFWTTTTGPAARRGFCTIQAVETLGWSGPAATRSYPPAGSSSVATGGLARLTVDAAGHATTPASLTQAAGWPAGDRHGRDLSRRTRRALARSDDPRCARHARRRGGEPGHEQAVRPPTPAERSRGAVRTPAAAGRRLPGARGAFDGQVRGHRAGCRCESRGRASGSSRRRRAVGRSPEPRPWHTAAEAPRRRSGSRIARPCGSKRAEAGADDSGPLRGARHTAAARQASGSIGSRSSCASRRSRSRAARRSATCAGRSTRTAAR